MAHTSPSAGGRLAAIIAIAVKDIRLILRDRAASFFTFIFPLLLAIMFGYFFGGGGGSGNLSIGVVDEDATEGSSAFVSDLSSVDGIEVLSYPNVDEAKRKIRRGELTAAVVLPKGFADSVDGAFSGEGMRIAGFVSPGAKAETGLLTGKLTELGFRRMIDTFADPTSMFKQIGKAKESLAASKDIEPGRRATISSFLDSLGVFSKGMDDEDQKKETAGATPDTSKDETKGKEKKSALAGWKPVDVSFEELERDNTAPRSSFEISFPQGVVWGLMGCTLAFGISLAEERSRGTLLRLTTSPLSRADILLGKAAGCFVSCTLVQTMLLVMAVLPIFGVHISNIPAMIAAVLLCSTGFTGVMMLLAGLSKTESAAQGVGRAVMLVMALIGGGSVPLFILPKMVQTLSGVSPFKWATLLIEGGLWRNFSPADMLLPGGIMLVIGVVGFAVGSAMFRWQE